MDFPTWVALGSYGGFACALLAAGSVSLLALRLRRGSRQQIARASLVSLIACALMLAPIWWLLRRFDVYGPALGAQEVAFWLVWISLFGWVIPLLTTAFFFALASPEPRRRLPQTRVSGAPIAATPLDDPARQIYPVSGQITRGGVWRLWTMAPPLSLSICRSKSQLIGRDPEDDIILDDDLVSRRHAEARWRAGQVYLLDRGSLNGTRRNAQKVRGLVALEDGDILQFGVRRYRFALLAPTGDDALEETRKVATSSASHPLNALIGACGETWRARRPALGVERADHQDWPRSKRPPSSFKIAQSRASMLRSRGRPVATISPTWRAATGRR